MSSPGRHRTASCHPRVGRDEGMPQAPEQDRAAASSPSRTRSLSNPVPPGTARPLQQGGQRHQVPDDDDVDVVRLSADLDGARPTPPGHRPGPPGHQHRTPLDGFNAPQVCRTALSSGLMGERRYALDQAVESPSNPHATQRRRSVLCSSTGDVFAVFPESHGPGNEVVDSCGRNCG